MKACPFCAEEIQDAAIVCRYCGYEVTEGSLKAARNASNGGTTLLVVVSLVAMIIGIVETSQVTLGVALIGMACLFAIWARIWQAGFHFIGIRDSRRFQSTK